MKIPSPEEYRTFLEKSLEEVKELHIKDKIKCSKLDDCECDFLRDLGQVYQRYLKTKDRKYLEVFNEIHINYYGFLEKRLNKNPSGQIKGKEAYKVLNDKQNLPLEELIPKHLSNSDHHIQQ